MIRSFRDILEKKATKRASFVDEKTAIFVFKEVIRDEFGRLGAENFIPERFSGGTIFVKAISPSWASELWLNRERVVRRMEEKVGKKIINRIKVI